MKKSVMPRAAAVLCAATLFTALLAGCGDSGESTAATYDYGYDSSESYSYDVATTELAEEALEYSASGSAESSMTPEADDTEQKIIYTADIDMESTDFDAACDKLNEAIEQADAWLEYSRLYGTAEDGDRSANYTVRVPVENYRSFLESIGDAGSVLSLSESAEDITTSYIDVQARLTALENQRDRLNELAEQAETTADLIEIENSLSDVQYQLESYTQQLRHMDSQVSYSTVDIYLDEVATLTPTGVSFAERLLDAFAGGWASFVSFIQGLVLALVYLWPVLLVVAAVVACIVVYRRRHPKPRRAKKAAPLAPAATYATPYTAPAEAPETPEAPKPEAADDTPKPKY